MTRTNHTIRKLTVITGSLLGIVALLALAVPAVAHDHSQSDFDDGPAGTIASFEADSGKLVIDLAGGGSISGLVTRFTWIDSSDGCDDRRGRQQLHDWCRRQLHLEHGSEHNSSHDSRGSADDLVVGAVVDDALLVLKDGRAFYAKIDLED
jgi:hypothetical protein